MRKWFDIKNEAERPKIYIYGDIGESWWDDNATSAADFVEAIKPFASVPIDIHINSCGGDVFDGIAIYTAIKQRKADTTCYVDGLAASAASVLAMGANTIVMANGSFMMIHRASCCVWGNADDLTETASWLEKIDSSLAEIYNQRTGIDTDEIMTMLAETTWFTASEAVEQGFADEVDGEVLKAAAYVDKRILAKYANTPEHLSDLIATESDTGEIIPPEPIEPKAPEAKGAEIPEVSAQSTSKFTVLHSGVYKGDK